MNINVSNLISIKNYNAGVNGNLLVVAQDKVQPVSFIGHKGKDKFVDVLLCTAKILDEETIKEIERFVDEKTPANRVIVVSKKFLKMRNKKQLALLTIESTKAAIGNKQSTNVDGLILGETEAVEIYGKYATYRAVNKARKVREKSTKKATRWMHHDYKKDCRVAAKMDKTAEKAKEKNEQENIYEEVTSETATA